MTATKGTRHDEQLMRLARIEGQVRGIKRMVEEGEYCIDIANQVQAARAALQAVGRNVLRKHLDSCVGGAFRSRNRDEAEQKLDELMAVLKRMT